MAALIDDNDANEKSDKSRCQLINIRCTGTTNIKFDYNRRIYAWVCQPGSLIRGIRYPVVSSLGRYSG